MTKNWELLESASHLIGAGMIYEGRSVLERVIGVEPQNIEAWEIYMHTFDSRYELEHLKDVVDVIWKTKVRDDDYLMGNRRYIMRRLDEMISGL